jgi:hypothetical protein
VATLQLPAGIAHTVATIASCGAALLEMTMTKATAMS